MSIDARIISVSQSKRGTFVSLEPREQSGHAGQVKLEVLEPPTFEELVLLIGCHIWGGSGWLQCGEHKLAERVGYTRIKLDEHWQLVAAAWKEKHEKAQ